MTKRVLDVGNCEADHAAIRSLIEKDFDARIDRAHTADETFDLLAQHGYDLVLINRVLDRDGSVGIEILKQVKANPELAAVPAMLVTNYADHQQAAVALGAVEGFGKSSLHEATTLEKLRAILD